MKDTQKKSAVEMWYEEQMAQMPPCPTALKTEVGCKVSWSHYATREEADIAAAHAWLNARLMESYGYDFGWLCPGDVSELKNGTFSVVFP